MPESNSTVFRGLAIPAHSDVRKDLSSPIQEFPYIRRVVLHFPWDIYQLLAAALGGAPNLMNAFLPSSVEVQIDNGTTSMYYRGHISDILPSQNLSPDSIFDGYSSPRDVSMAPQFHNSMPSMYSPYQAASGMGWESWDHTTTTPESGTGSSGFEFTLDRDLNGHAALQVHHPSLPEELFQTTQPLLPPVSFNNTVAPLSSVQPPFLRNATFSEIPSADRRISHHTEYGSQLAHGQIQQPGSPRIYMVDGLPVDEEYLIDENTGDNWINVHTCSREDTYCGLWVKADRRSIMRHGQRWHQDPRGGGDRKVTCPWSGCNSQMRASAIPRHTLSAHFGATWTCRGTRCSKVFTRHDSFKAHSRKCGSLGEYVVTCSNSEPHSLPTFGNIQVRTSGARNPPNTIITQCRIF